MAYQGISPYLYRNNLTNVQLLDDISASFNGTTTQFNLTTNGSPFHAVSARSLLIILGGIVQEPDVDYTVNAGVITFTTAPLSGLTFAARNIYGLNRLTGINDGLVTPASLSLGGPEWDTSGNLTVDGNITQTGETNNVYINTDTPTVRPTLDLNFERDQRLDSRITFSRDSTATYLGSDGLIKTALAGEPRFEFDTDGNCLGLLIEESRTNILLQSQEFTSTYWSDLSTLPTGWTTTAGPAPDGSNTVTTWNSSNQIYESHVSYSVGPQYTASVFVKDMTGGGGSVRLGPDHTTDYVGGDPRVTFQPSTKSFTSVGSGVQGYGYYEYANGWYRVWFKYTLSQSDNIFNIVQLGAYNIGIWGAQIEAGSFPTSYIPTSGSTVTRSADNASITGTNFTDFYNASEGTLMSHYDAKVNDYYISTFELSSNPGDNRIALVNFSSYQGLVINGGSNQASLDNGTPTVGGSNKVALAFKENDFSVSLNGASPVADSSGTLPTVDRLMIGTRAGFDILNSTIKQLKYYPERLSNAQLQNLTS